MVKPGGTGRPSEAMSCRFNPLPPSRFFVSLLPSARSALKEYTHFVMSCFPNLNPKVSTRSVARVQFQGEVHPAHPMKQKVDAEQGAKDVNAVERPAAHDDQSKQDRCGRRKKDQGT